MEEKLNQPLEPGRAGSPVQVEQQGTQLGIGGFLLGLGGGEGARGFEYLRLLAKGSFEVGQVDSGPTIAGARLGEALQGRVQPGAIAGRRAESG